MPDGEQQNAETGFYESYVDFSRTVRTWLVAYGIGAPVLFLSNERAASLLAATRETPTIVVLFLIGVGSQVLGAIIFKCAMWYLYLGELRQEFRARRRYRVSYLLSEAFWLELAIDLLAIGCFVYATWRVLRVLTA